MERESAYLDGCVGRVAAVAHLDPPELPGEAFEDPRKGGRGDPRIAHGLYTLVEYDRYGVTLANVVGRPDATIFVPWGAVVRIEHVGERGIFQDLGPDTRETGKGPQNQDPA